MRKTETSARPSADRLRATLGQGQSRLQDRNHDFQREVLLGLQDQVRRLGRACFRVIMQDLKTLDEQGKLFGLPEDLDQRLTTQASRFSKR